VTCFPSWDDVILALKSLQVTVHVLFASLFCLICCWCCIFGMNKDYNNINRTEHEHEHELGWLLT